MLLLDIGNSRCKWARVERGAWLSHGVLDNAQLDRLPELFSQMSRPSRILVSNVAGEAVAERVLGYCEMLHVTPHFIQADAECCGVRNGYHSPRQLGSDRWAALIAARRRYPGACLVVNSGTATTIDALAANGEFLGGLIVPGLSLMLSSLSGNTAGLSVAVGNLQDFPETTADAMFSGAVWATQGAIRRQFELLSQREGVASCVMSGGAALTVMAGMPFACDHEAHLVLHGLQILGEREE